MHSIRWGDLQYVLAVANEGSLSAAARSLGVNHSTVLRRLDAFEYRHKLQVFHKLSTGYKLTVEGQKLLASALAVENTVKELEHKIFGQEMKLEGTLRLTTTDALSRLVLGTHLATFHERYPKIQLDLNLTSRQIDISHLDADVAIRTASEIPSPLVGTKLCKIAFGVYGAPDYIDSLQGKHPLESASWLVMLQGNASIRISELISKEKVVMKADSFEPLLIAAENKMGLAYLPCFMGEGTEKLQRVNIEVNHQSTDLWMMTHKDLENAARVKALFDFMPKAMKSDFNRLAGFTS
ncbi:LysR family transcriptional regulator [Alteromonas stellipolaris]|uniref:LysR family transcriptional regulator n=1 Tax=Alteromonas stellipolaris TaxID=233316 RepID=A0AAW7Z1D6_9ALTE|nr:LysR family transcriptional regulator [Alteromonas stellipolaris]AMJ93603.1 transcriptional regulator [Alteromonas stellipolaris]ANB19853.1 transcriptional regulator [Alteromonas stellipolaris]ANB26249.1 transcriptional regulator [Alteromonas stellipolaris]MDO6534249.1 LysR family transcriptional regulator [Alteromonas stellipolaris]MDO6576293.1 LysR family transcriptional regulator [Alteromonas stellipolaris]